MQTGTSDPYCQVILNGNKIYKTKTQKKTLNPIWNESFQANITARLRSTLEIQVRDWNQLAKDVTIGTVNFQLGKLAPNDVVVADFPLEGATKGSLKIRLFFDPQVVSHSKASMDVLSGGDENAVSKFGKGVMGTVTGTTVGLVSGVGKALDVGEKKTQKSNIDAIIAAKGLRVDEIRKEDTVAG